MIAFLLLEMEKEAASKTFAGNFICRVRDKGCHLFGRGTASDNECLVHGPSVLIDYKYAGKPWCDVEIRRGMYWLCMRWVKKLRRR